MRQKMDISKFSFGQMTSNADGKTSGSGTMGIYICVLGVVAFMFGVCDFMWGTKKNDVMFYSTGIISIGAGLLGWRKHKSSNVGLLDTKEVPKIDNIEGQPQGGDQLPK